MDSKIVKYYADDSKTIEQYPVTLTKAIYDDNGNRLDNTLNGFVKYDKIETETVEPVADIDADILGGKYTADDIDGIVDNVDSLATSQGRNLIPFPYYNKNITKYGVTFTVNDDGSITANGTATKLAAFQITATRTAPNFFPKSGKYTFTGCPSGGDTKKYGLLACQSNTDGSFYAYGRDYGDGASFEITDARQANGLDLRIEIPQGATVSNLTFYPMLEEGTISHAYEPTTEANVTLKKSVDAIGAYNKDTPYLLNVNVLDLSIKNGIYWVVGCTGLPIDTNNNGYLEVISRGDGYRKLMYQNYIDNDWYVNSCIGGTWSGWEKLVKESELNGLETTTSKKKQEFTTTTNNNIPISDIPNGMAIFVATNSIKWSVGIIGKWSPSEYYVKWIVNDMDCSLNGYNILIPTMYTYWKLFY